MTSYDHENELSLIGNILNEDDSKGSNNIPLFQYCGNHELTNSDGQVTPNTNIIVRSVDNLSLVSDPTCQSLFGRSAESYRYWSIANHNNNATSIDGDCSPKQVFDPYYDYVPEYPIDSQLTPCRGKNKYRKPQPVVDFQYNSERILGHKPQTKHHHNQLRVPHAQFQQYPQKQWEMEQISEDIQLSNELDQLCGNQMLSRKIQKVFEFGRDDQKELIFNKIERACMQFSKDIFGNYIVQKVIEKGQYHQRMKLFAKLRPQFYELSKHNFGCRVIQKILECIQNEPDLQEKFLEQIRSQIKSLIYDVHGNYVILKCLDTLPKEALMFMMPAIQDSVAYMVQQTYGCRILQKIMETYGQDEIAKITKLTVSLCHILCQSEYGNYIIQHVLKFGPPCEQEVLFSLIRTNFYALSLNKYGSNTVEKYIEIADRESLKELTSMMLKGTQQEPFFFTLATHPFGNYVFKKYLIMGDIEMLDPIMQMLRNAPLYVNRIKISEYGQRVYMVLEKLIGQI